MKKILLIISFLSLPFFTFAEIENVGIIKGIWFSDSQFFDGDTIRIYTAVQNNSGSDADGTIEFFDNDQSLGIKTFSALDNRIIESWMDTIAVSGEHQFSVKITQLKKGDTDVSAQDIFSERIKVVKIDTDGDNIPDDIDTDDDADGISDVDEIAAGSDPLDNQSIPVEEKDTSNNSLGTIINNIFNSGISNAKHDSISGNTNIKNDLLEQSPDLAQKVAEQNNVIKSLVLQISRLQNSGQNIIEHEQQRIVKSEQVDTPITENGTEKVIKNKNKTKTVDNKVKKETDKKSSFKNILLSIYGIFLNIFAWLFSLWWFVVILLFLGIYVLLRLLFKIFGRDRD